MILLADCPCSMKKLPVCPPKLPSVNGGTGNWVILLEFEKNVERSTQLSSGRWIGAQPMDTSIPRLRSSPPLKNWLLKPLELASPRNSRRSQIGRASCRERV